MCTRRRERAKIKTQRLVIYYKFVGYLDIDPAQCHPNCAADIREGVELTDERKATIERDRKELCGEFCRGCGYCMPCPAGIEINQCARMSLMLRRAPAAAWLTEEWQQKMHQIENCRHCGHCMSKCPYGLNTPELLQANYKDYWEVLAASKAEK